MSDDGTKFLCLSGGELRFYSGNSEQKRVSSSDTRWKSRILAALDELREKYPEIADEWSPRRPTSKARFKVEQLVREIKRDDLPVPFVGPSIEGGLRIAWRRNDRTLEIIIRPNGSAEFMTLDLHGEPMEGKLTTSATTDELIIWLMA